MGHILRDSTAIEVREKPVKKAKKAKVKRKKGRPKKGEEVVKEPTRLERQSQMNLEQMLEDLPKDCDVGRKKNSQGHTKIWIGYKYVYFFYFFFFSSLVFSVSTFFLFLSICFARGSKFDPLILEIDYNLEKDNLLLSIVGEHYAHK